MTRRLVSTLGMTLLAVARPVGADAPAPIDYVVRADDTLWSLSERCLGDPHRWGELLRLNPQLDDPDVVRVGERLALPAGCVEAPPPPPPSPTPPPTPPPTTPPTPAEAPATGEVGAEPPNGETAYAAIEWARNRVEELRPPRPWQRTDSGRVLDVGHAVRTFRRASASLAFFDDAEVVLEADSLIFLRDRIVRDRDRYGKIEIVEGAVDLLAQKQPDKPAAEVALQAAGALAEPAFENLETHLRARVDDEGSVRFMAFEGTTRVSGAETSIDLEPGTGTVVVRDRPPGRAEALVSAPHLIEETSAVSPDAFAELSWSPVPGAVGYRVTVCRDRRCTRTVANATPTENRWSAPRLEAGDYTWRVSAISPSGGGGGGGGGRAPPPGGGAAPPPDPSSSGHRLPKRGLPNLSCYPGAACSFWLS